MNSFLQHIVDELPADPTTLKDWCFVFPSKRAGKYFEELLRQHYEAKTFWFPRILGIEDYVFARTGIKPAEEISMVFHLYEVYKTLEKNVDFEKYYSWGQVVLSDFDEIDRNLIDADKLYGGLKSREEIDLMFGENEELEEAYSQFSRLFDGDKTELQRRFQRSWEQLRDVYHLLQERMKKEGMYLAGSLFRQCAEHPGGDPFDRTIFAGFNALAGAEEAIMKQSLQSGNGYVYFDTDALYMSNPREEAGLFLREYKKSWNYAEVRWIETRMLEDDKVVESVGCPQMVSQAKVASRIVQEANLSDVSSRTAIVLGDEHLMMPVLHSLPVERVNVTMGYPLKSTSIYHFVLETLRLHAEARESDGARLLEAGRVISLLKSPMISPVFTSQTVGLSGRIRSEKRKWIKAEELVAWCEGSWLALIFGTTDDYTVLLYDIEQFLVKLFYYLKTDEETDEASFEIIYFGLRHLIRFRENMQRQSFTPGLAFLSRLYSESARSLKIPFSGEPLEGLQIMGFLETRALDFENVIVLGVNENKLPTSALGTSYIPFSARKAFGLPTHVEHQAIYAYHFKRLMQRAKNIWLLHDTEVAVDGSGEKSRYVLQLQHATAMQQGFEIKEKIIRVPYSPDKEVYTLTVEKSAAIRDKLHRYLDPENPKLWSPTRLVHYIECKLRFYLKYVAKVPETEPMMEQIDARVFGNILHHAMEMAYQPYLGKVLTAEDLSKIESKIPEHVRQALREANVVHSTYQLHGADILLEGVIKQLIKKILDGDRKQLPFKVTGVEEKLVMDLALSGGRIARIGGVVDRVDEKDSIPTIIDYKTGRVDMVPRGKAGLEDAVAYVDQYFSDGKYKSGFQTYFYAMITQQLGSEQVKGAVYELKRVSKGKNYLRQGKPIPTEILKEFERRLVQVIEEIVDPSVDFDQTSDSKKCLFCPYKVICQR